MLRACFCVFYSARFRNSERSVWWKHNTNHTQKFKVSNSHFDIKVTYRERETGEINLDNIFYVSTIPKILSFQPVINIIIIELFCILFFLYYVFEIWVYFTLVAYLSSDQPHFVCSVVTCGLWLPYWTVQL